MAFGLRCISGSTYESHFESVVCRNGTCAKFVDYGGGIEKSCRGYDEPYTNIQTLHQRPSVCFNFTEVCN